MNLDNKLDSIVIGENMNHLDDFWNDVDVEELIEVNNILRKSETFTDLKNNFHTPDFNSNEINLKMSPINKHYDHPEQVEEGANFMTFEQFHKYKNKEINLKKHKTIKEKLNEFILKYDNSVEEKKNKLVNVLNSKKEKKVGETRSNILYEKGMIKNELIKMIYEKNNQIKSVNELKDCTFKPNIIKSNKTLKYLHIEKEKDQGKTLYDRNLKWKNKNNERIIKEKSLKGSDSEYTFKPQLCKHKLENVFYSNEKPNYLLYVNRIEQVRREHEEKMKNANVRLPKNENPKWNHYTRRMLTHHEGDNEVLFDNTYKNEELSLDDVKRSLHYKLHSQETI